MDNTQLLKRIEALEKWKAEREKQQIVFPLDNRSIEILERYFMHITSVLEYDAGVGSNHFVHFLGKQGTDRVNKNTNSAVGGVADFQIEVPSYVSYTVNTSTDYITTTQISGNLKFFNDDEVVLYTDGTVPSPLSAGLGVIYYVINSDGYTFQLSATLAGAAINITDTGSGRQFITYS